MKIIKVSLYLRSIFGFEICPFSHLIQQYSIATRTNGVNPVNGISRFNYINTFFYLFLRAFQRQYLRILIFVR